MPSIRCLAIPTLALAASSCATVAELRDERLASAMLSRADGVPVGTVQIFARGDTTFLTVAATGLSPGVHGFHLHTTGNCTAPDFKSAGGHLNPQGRQHGSLNPAGKHLGDLDNLAVDASGTASASADLALSREALLEALFDADGSAVVIHADADDYTSDPAGNAGARIACGVLQPTAS